MKRPDAARWAPPGLDTSGERRVFRWGMFLSLLVSFLFFPRYFFALNELYSGIGQNRRLIPGAVMEPFGSVLDCVLCGFLVTALVMAGFLLRHYAYHWQGSRSIYLMRRLPDRWELHRRCLAQPLFFMALCVLAALALLLLYYILYVTLTPAECLPPELWR